MFKCIITEHFGPFCGRGGYGSETKIGMDRSPKKAVAKARQFVNFGDGSQIRRATNENPETGIVGGGVPIMREFRLYKNSKLIVCNWD
jgi:hypothetical protein